jgi:hypothetical protein
MSNSSANKRKRPGRDAESRDDSSDSCLDVLVTGPPTLRNKLQRSDCSDVGSSYNKLMLQNLLTATTAPTPTHTQHQPQPQVYPQTQAHPYPQQHTTPTRNSDTQNCWSTPNNHNHNHNHNTTNSISSRQNHTTTSFQTPTPAVLATTTDVALLIKELLELCASNYKQCNNSNHHNHSTDNKAKAKEQAIWKETRDKLWLLGEAAFQNEGARDVIGHMGGCLVVTQCLKAAVQAVPDIATATASTASDPSFLLSTLLLSVQEAACFCLTNLTYRHPANRHRLMAAGGASVLVSLLRAHTCTGPMQMQDSATVTATCSTNDSANTAGSQVGTVLSRACMVLDNLAASESCQEEIVQADVMEAVCATMLAFPAARELQFSGCRILGRLAESCQQNGKHQQQQVQQQQHQQQVRLRAVRANALVAVAQAFEQFCQTDTATARMASAALQCLTALWSDTQRE